MVTVGDFASASERISSLFRASSAEATDPSLVEMHLDSIETSLVAAIGFLNAIRASTDADSFVGELVELELDLEHVWDHWKSLQEAIGMWPSDAAQGRTQEK